MDVRNAAIRLASFWLVVPCYILFRFLLFGQLGGPSYSAVGQFSPEYKLSGVILSITDPLLIDISWGQAIGLFAIVFAVFLLYSRRRVVLFGGIWVVVTFLAFISLPVEERYFYIPSIGFVLALAGILVNPLPRAPKISLAVGMVVTAF